MRSRHGHVPRLKTDEQGIDETLPTITVEDRNIKTVSVTPAVMLSIKESMERVLRSNPKIVKAVIRDCLISDPNFVREIFDEVLFRSQGVSQLKSMDRRSAKEVIAEYITKNPGCKTSDIIMALELEPSFVMEILKELKQEGVVQSKAIEQ